MGAGARGAMTSPAGELLGAWAVELSDTERTLRITSPSTQRARTLVFDQRVREYRRDQSYLLDLLPGAHQGSDPFDARAHLFACHERDELVASARIASAAQGETPIARLIGAAFPFELSTTVEVSRVLVSNSHRGKMAGEALLLGVVHGARAGLGYQHYYAFCIEAVAAFYKVLGAARLDVEPIQLPGRRDRRYVVVHGDLAATEKRIQGLFGRKGWIWRDGAQAASSV
jgi:predicted GNAT family N-acyltransferase